MFLELFSSLFILSSSLFGVAAINKPILKSYSSGSFNVLSHIEIDNELYNICECSLTSNISNSLVSTFKSDNIVGLYFGLPTDNFVSIDVGVGDLFYSSNKVFFQFGSFYNDSLVDIETFDNYSFYSNDFYHYILTNCEWSTSIGLTYYDYSLPLTNSLLSTILVSNSFTDSLNQEFVNNSLIGSNYYFFEDSNFSDFSIGDFSFSFSTLTNLFGLYFLQTSSDLILSDSEYNSLLNDNKELRDSIKEKESEINSLNNVISDLNSRIQDLQNQIDNGIDVTSTSEYKQLLYNYNLKVQELNQVTNEYNSYKETYNEITYQAKFNEGKSSVTTESANFLGLFSAIASVPITILNGLTSFVIWDTPLISILLSLLLVMIILLIIRKFI